MGKSRDHQGICSQSIEDTSNRQELLMDIQHIMAPGTTFSLDATASVPVLSINVKMSICDIVDALVEVQAQCNELPDAATTMESVETIGHWVDATVIEWPEAAETIKSVETIGHPADPVRWSVLDDQVQGEVVTVAAAAEPVVTMDQHIWQTSKNHNAYRDRTRWTPRLIKIAKRHHGAVAAQLNDSQFLRDFVVAPLDVPILRRSCEVWHAQPADNLEALAKLPSARTAEGTPAALYGTSLAHLPSARTAGGTYAALAGTSARHVVGEPSGSAVREDMDNMYNVPFLAGQTSVASAQNTASNGACKQQ
jgi:hypothetical protein